MPPRALTPALDPLPLDLLDRYGRPFKVRHFAAPADRARLEAMYTAFEPQRGAQGLPPKTSGIARWLDRVLAHGDHVLVEIDGTVVGHLMLLPMDDDRVELANFLHQSARNRGIGTALNRIALDIARVAGARSVWLCVEPTNRAAVRSYEKAGFRRRPGTLWAAEIEMEKELDDPGGDVAQRPA